MTKENKMKYKNLIVERYPIAKNKIAHLILIVLRKLNWISNYNLYTEKFKFEDIVIDIEKLLNHMHKMIDDYYCLTGKQPKKIIMGIDQRNVIFEQAKQNMLDNYYLDIPATHLFGMEIEVNPMFDGIVVTK